VLEAVDAVLSPLACPCQGGASAFVEPTRALVAVDVNTGGDMSLAAGLKANIALARDLPRQLRLRGLGGQIVLDLAPMPKKERRGFETVLNREFRQDGAEVVLAGWTPLGHFEIQKKRDRRPLAQLWPGDL
jgi:ribonuclease G